MIKSHTNKSWKEKDGNKKRHTIEALKILPRLRWKKKKLVAWITCKWECEIKTVEGWEKVLQTNGDNAASWEEKREGGEGGGGSRNGGKIL